MRKVTGRPQQRKFRMGPSPHSFTGIQSRGKKASVKFFVREADGSMSRVKVPSPDDLKSVSVLKDKIARVAKLTEEESSLMFISCIYTGMRGERLVQVGYDADNIPSHRLSQLRGMVFDVVREKKVCAGSTYTIPAVADEDLMRQMSNGSFTVRPEKGANEYGGEIDFTEGEYTLRYYNQGTVLNMFLWQGDVFIVTHTNINASSPNARYGYGPNYVDAMRKMDLVDVERLFPAGALFWPICYRFIVTTPHNMTASRYTFHKDGYLTYLGSTQVWEFNDEPFVWSSTLDDSEDVNSTGISIAAATRFYQSERTEGITRILTEHGAKRYFVDVPTPVVAAQDSFFYNSQGMSLSSNDALVLLKYGFFSPEWYSFLDYEYNRYLPRTTTDEWKAFSSLGEDERPDWEKFLESRYKEIHAETNLEYPEYFQSMNVLDVNPLGRMGEALILVKRARIGDVVGTLGVRLMPPDYAKRWEVHNEYGADPYKNFLHNIHLHTIDTKSKETEYVKECAKLVKFRLHLPFPHVYNEGGSSALVPSSMLNGDDLRLQSEIRHFRLKNAIDNDMSLHESDRGILGEYVARLYHTEIGAIKDGGDYMSLYREFGDLLIEYSQKMQLSPTVTYFFGLLINVNDPRTPLAEDMFSAYVEGVSKHIDVDADEVAVHMSERLWEGANANSVAETLAAEGLPNRPPKVPSYNTVFDYERLVRSGATFMPGIYCRAVRAYDGHDTVEEIKEDLLSHVKATRSAVSLHLGSVSDRVAETGRYSVSLYEIVFWYLVMCNPMNQQQTLRCSKRYQKDVENLASFVASSSFDSEMQKLTSSKDISPKNMKVAVDNLKELRATYKRYIVAKRNMKMRSGSMAGGGVAKPLTIGLGEEDIDVAKSCVIRVEGKLFLKVVNAVYASKGTSTISISDPSASIILYRNRTRR